MTMLLDQSFRRQRWFWATVPAALSGVLALAAPGAAYAQAMHEITVTISEVRMLDRGDVPIAGQADLYAVVTIGGEVLKTQRVRNQDRITPNWTLSKKVAPGNHDIKVQIVMLAPVDDQHAPSRCTGDVYLAAIHGRP